MDVSELRKRILRALDDARKQAVARRSEVDEASKAFESFLEAIAVPLMRQAASVLNANGNSFSVQTPAQSVRLVSDGSSQTFVELALDTSGPQSQVIGRVSLARGRQALVVEERPIALDKQVSALTDEDVSAFLVSEIPKLVLKPS